MNDSAAMMGLPPNVDMNVIFKKYVFSFRDYAKTD